MNVTGIFDRMLQVSPNQSPRSGSSWASVVDHFAAVMQAGLQAVCMRAGQSERANSGDQVASVFRFQRSGREREKGERSHGSWENLESVTRWKKKSEAFERIDET